MACYTAGDYEREAHDRLLPSLQALHLPHDVRLIESQGSWIANGFACQEFLLGMCREFPAMHLLFLDVDAVVHTDPWPYLLSLSCDLAAHYMRDRELLTGTLYVPAGPRREEILERWIQRNRERPGVWDQLNLQKMLEEDKTIRVSRLPAEFCFIFDTQRRLTPHLRPVIEHFQASRRFKRRGRYVPAG